MTISSLSYVPTDPDAVLAVTRLRAFPTADRTGPATLDLTSPVQQPDGSWTFTVLTQPADGTYHLSTTVTYTDGLTVEDTTDTLTVPFFDSGLVPVSTYRDVTGDTTTPDQTVASRLIRAQRKVEAHLRRPLPLDERTERVRLRDYAGWGLFGGGSVAYPAATPVVSATGLRVEGNAVIGAASSWLSWQDGADRYADITYLGGWTAETLPEPIVEAICSLARAAGQPSPVPAGATSVRNGDVAVTFAARAAGAQLDPAVTAALRPYVRRRL